MTVRVVVADRMPADFLDALARAGHDSTYEPALTAGTLPDHLDGAETLVVRGTEVTAAALAAGRELRLVVRAGSGTNTIDCAAASRRGVLVANVPGSNAIAVAELAMALLLAVDRAIPDNTSELRAGRWDKPRFSQVAHGLYGRRMGIVGLGSIGIEVAIRARAFGLHLATVAAGSRSARAQARIDELGIDVADNLEALAAKVDVLSLHVPLTSATAGMVDRDVLAALAPGILINTSRGGVVNADALLERLDRGDIAAGLDVFPDEPTGGAASWSSPLARHPRVVGTHHVGASTAQAQAAVAAGALEVIDAFVRGEPINVVNAVDLLEAVDSAESR